MVTSARPTVVRHEGIWPWTRCYTKQQCARRHLSVQGCLDSECRSRGTNFTGAVRPCVGASIHASFSGKCHQPPVPLPAARVPLLLIVHVASGGRALSINRSIAAMGRGVDWLLLPHREMHVAALQPLTRCGSLLGHACGRGDELDLTSVLVKAPREESAARFRPKLLFQLNAAGVAKRRRREYVWLADDDISFVGLDVAGYFALHASVGAPLISAPLISARLSRGGATQKPEFLSNRRQWAAALSLRRPARPRAVPCALVEQHAPLLDAAFFEWLAGASSGSRGVALRELAALQDAAGSDWGLDMLWCGAARAYAFETAVDAGALRTPCALLLGVAIDHQNSRTIAKHDTTATEGETLTFIDRGYYISALLWQTVRRGRETDYAIAANLTNPLPPTADAVFRRFAIEQLRLCLPTADQESAAIRARGVLHNNPWVPSRLMRRLCWCKALETPDQCIYDQQTVQRGGGRMARPDAPTAPPH